MVLQCAIRADGTLTCWGDAPYPQGQQPDGTFLRIVTKDTFGCALRVDRTLGCWGRNEYRDESSTRRTGTFVALSGQSANSCALDADGSPSCWGGPGGVEGMLPGPFDQVAAGSSFACGLRPSGAVECWGLGVGAGFVPAGTYTRISAWGQALCALQTDGSIRCWGDAFDAPPAEIQGEFVDVAAGPEVACARRATGELACFGGESYTLGLVPRVISTPPVIGAVGWYEHQLRMTTVFPSPAWTIAEGSLHRASRCPPPGAWPAPRRRPVSTPRSSRPRTSWPPAARRPLELDIAPASTLETGPVVVNGGAAATNRAVTSVFHPATGADEVRLSNDGTTWVVRPYAATTASWSLVDPATGGTAGDGTKRVWVSWRAAGGSWSTPASDTILSTGPLPAWGCRPRRSAPAGRSRRVAPVRVGWSGSDTGSGLARYELAESRDGGAWTSVATTLTGTSTARALAPVTPTGSGGEASTRRGTRRRGRTAPRRGWAATRRRARRSATAARGEARPARRTGAARSARRRRQARPRRSRSQAVASPGSRRGPTRGVARVYVNDTYVASVDLRRTVTRTAQVVFARSWSTTATRRLTIRVSGTPG